MALLFKEHFLEKKIKESNISVGIEQIKIFQKWDTQISNHLKNETQLQADFLNDIFGKALGYQYERGTEELNLEKEEKTDLDSSKPDAVLGFFTKESKTYKVIIELKGQTVDLQAKQNRSNNQNSIEQAFSYVTKYGGKSIDFVIVSNFKEIRLYDKDYQGNFQSFKIEDLAHNTEVQKQFLFLFNKENLIGLNKNYFRRA